MKFGFEREFFCVDSAGKYCLAGTLPQDSCGYLAEARGEAHITPDKALALYFVEERRLQELAAKANIELRAQDYVSLDNKLRRRWLRQFGKNASDEGSMYGRFRHTSLSTAGLHIHFSNETESYRSGQAATTYHIIDMPRYILGLDKMFAQEIRDAKRVPGLYEMKPYGFEYRSLPTSVDLFKVVEALNYLSRQRWNSDFSWSTPTTTETDATV